MTSISKAYRLRFIVWYTEGDSLALRRDDFVVSQGIRFCASVRALIGLPIILLISQHIIASDHLKIYVNSKHNHIVISILIEGSAFNETRCIHQMG